MKPAAIALLVVLAVVHGGAAQAQSDQERVLQEDVKRRFEVLPLQNGVALVPKAADVRVRSIEIADGAIALDGFPATGSELREKLGADADLVLRLSYLDRASSRRLFGAASGAAPAAPSAGEPQAPEATSGAPTPGARRRSANGGDLVRFGRDVIVGEGEAVAGDAVAIGGSVRVDGEVAGNVVAIGGGLVLGPHADVRGDAVNIGGALERDPGARIGGSIVDLSGVSRLNLGLNRARFPIRRFLAFSPFGVAAPFFGMPERLISLVSTVARVFVLWAFASLVLLVGRQYVDRAAAEASAKPIKAGAVGLVAQLLVGPLLVMAIVILVVTIIGIPLLVLVPFALLALAIVALVGFTSVVYHLGSIVNRRFDWPERNHYLTAVTGIIVLVSPVLIARLLGLAGGLLFPLTAALAVLGFLVEYAAWTVGFGAVTLLRFARPSLPPAPPPTAA